MGTQAFFDPKTPQWQTTVAEQRGHNIHVRDGVDDNGAAYLRMPLNALPLRA